MEFENTSVEGARVCSIRKYPDIRGSFCEIFRREWLPSVFDDAVQMNCSNSIAGVLRGMHYHLQQWDFWVPVRGRMNAGLADLRKDSPTFGKSLTIPMDGRDMQGLLIPPGVAHGYAALTELTLIYVVSRYYDCEDEHGIAWDDPRLDIQWGIKDPILSERDITNSPFSWEN